jgi:hypothetical protein
VAIVRVTDLVTPPESGAMGRFRETPGPAGEIVVVILTFPVKPFKLRSVIVEVSDPPAGKAMDKGAAEIWKSFTVTGILAKLETGPLVAFTVIK